MKTQKLVRTLLTAALFFITVSMLNNAFGKHRRITSTRGLGDAVKTNDLVVALFYVEKKGIDKHVRERLHDTQKAFRSVSKDETYDYAAILFSSVNTAKQDMIDMVVEYGVTRPEPDSPSLALFREGKMIACLNGFQDREGIRGVIDQYFTQDIARITKAKDALRQRQLETARQRAYERAAWWGGGYPYYGGWYGYGAGWPYYGGYYWGPTWSWRSDWGWRGGWGGGYRGGCRTRCR